MQLYRYLSTFLLCGTFLHLNASVHIITSLTYEVAHCKKIVLAKYLYHDQYQHFFLVKELDSPFPYRDTIKMLISPSAYQISDDGGFSFQPFTLEEAEEFLIIIGDHGSRDSTQVSGSYYIKHNDQIYSQYWSASPSGRPYYSKIQDTILWTEFVERIKGIQKRMSPILKLKDKPTLPDRNRILLSWLQDFIQNNYDTCGRYEDCGWGYLEHNVINWIVTSGNMDDAWTASQFHRQIEIRKRPHLEHMPMFGLYEGGTETYTSKEGIDFLMGIALNKNLPMDQRNQALIFLEDAVQEVYACSKTYPYECKVQQSALQKSTLKKILPLFHNPDLNYYAFVVYQNLCQPLNDHQKYPITRYKFEDLVQLFNEHRFKDSDFRYVLATFLADACTPEEWKSISGNQNNLLIILAGSGYDSTNRVLKYYINTNQREPYIIEVPKIRFERIIDGQVDTTLIKESFQFYKPPLNSYDGGKEMKADLSDLPPGSWHYYVFGVAGKETKVPWTSLGGTFVQK
jgi:hypothetical protein